MVAGTWVVSAKGRGSSSDRWAVAGHLFPIKYRLLRPGVYLNVDDLMWRPGEVGEVVQTLEGPRRLGEGEAVLRGVAGDQWIVPLTRIEGQGGRDDQVRYFLDSPRRRFRLLWQRPRRWHVLGRCTGAVGLLATLVAMLWCLTSGFDRLVGEGNSPLTAAAAVLPALGFASHRLLLPHRSRLPIVLVLVAEALWLIGLAGVTFGRLTNDVGRSIRVGLSTFSGGFDVDSFVGSPAHPGAANFAQTLAPFPAVILLIGALAAARAILRDAWDGVICHVRRFDVVVWGLTPPAVNLIRDLRLGPNTRRSQTRIAAVETDGDLGAVRLVRSLGVPVLVGSPDPSRTLRRVSCSLLRRDWTAQQIVAATKDSVVNVALADSAAAQARSNRLRQRSGGDPLWVTVLVNDHWTRNKVRSRSSLTSGGAYVRPIDGTSAAADALLDIVTGPGSNCMRSVLLVGHSTLTTEFLAALDRERRLRRALELPCSDVGGVSDPVAQVLWAESGIVGGAESDHLEQMGCRPSLGDEATDWVETVDPTTRWLDRVGELPEDPVVVLCGDAANASSLDRLHAEMTRLCRGTPQMIVEVDGGTLRGVDSSAGRMHGQPTGPWALSTGMDHIRLSEHTLGDVNAIADVIHRHFRFSRQRPVGDPADQDWRSYWLGTAARRETYAWVGRALDELARLGFEVVGATESVDSAVAFKDWLQVAEILGYREHQRWWEEKRSLGYSADLPTSSPFHKPDACDWSQLPAERREANVRPFAALPEVLDACGLSLVRR